METDRTRQGELDGVCQQIVQYLFQFVCVSSHCNITDILMPVLEQQGPATRFAGMKMAVFSGYSGADPDLGKAWQREVQAAFPDQLVELISLPLSICCHIGDGALGVACAKVW